MIIPAKSTPFLRFFVAHPASVNETYLQHFAFALRFSSRLLMAGGAAFVHALVPALFQTTASRQIRALHAELTARSTH